MEKSLIISITVLVMINVIDSISNSVVGPSLIFYVTEMGGTQEQYGLIMSAAFVSSMVMMTFYGAWVDSNGNKYRAPYAASFTLGIIGSFIYFLAILVPKGNLAVGAIFLGRLITGMGASGRTLAYSWVATAIPREEQRTTLTIMSLTKCFGMILGPLVNLLVLKVDTALVISSKFDIVIPINQNNSVGLIVALGEGIIFIATFLFLKDPPTKGGMINEKPAKAGLMEIWEAITHFDLFSCLLATFVAMFNFTFYSVAIPPVASHAFGWNPVHISNVLAAQAVVLFLGMCASMIFSMAKAPDILLIGFGNFCFVTGGAITYYFWTIDATSLQFVLPIMIVSLAFPFIGPANRSKYTKAVHSRPELENSHGVMQSLFNQAFSIGGLVSPNFAAVFILRSPKEMELRDSPYELSRWAWCIPILSTITIIGLLYEEVILGKNELRLYEDESNADLDDAPATETSKLMLGGKGVGNRRRSSIVEINQELSTQYEVDRRLSVEVNGIINPFETRDEIKLRDNLLQDKKEWEELKELAKLMDE
mmetsp:Transcript_39941/g.71986  ORF Transcript_39941/g.71986 Transcript_39941/m.71986 type:complete len:537 (-) Transcript_39941:90-1700(-)